MTFERDIDDVVEAVRKAKDRGKACALLIGAGCSAAAGIPLAGGFVEIIRRDWPRAYARAGDKTYPHCMAQLSPGERRDLITQYVDKARVNWAHIAIAQLLKAGFVDRVLTTNFDPLVLRACAMLNMFPGVYDFASSQHFKPGHTSHRAIFHLHGQHTGFVLLNTTEEVSSLSNAIAPLFEDAGRNRLWLVVGYSGEHDPVFEQLAGVKSFDERLYWIGHGDDEPTLHVRTRLLSEAKCAYFVKGFDADNFFVTFAQRLDCFPPELTERPFTHLKQVLDSLTLLTMPGSSEVDVGFVTRTMIEQAINMFEEGQRGQILLGLSRLVAGQLEKVKALRSVSMSQPLQGLVARAYAMQGYALADEAKGKSGLEADKLLRQAVDEYAEALKIQPDMHEALYNWGNVLLQRAEGKSALEASELLHQAGNKYDEALKIKPDHDGALHNWGIALARQAETKSGSDADSLFRQAYEKFAEALEIRADNHAALHSWGTALTRQARTKSGRESEELLRHASERYAQTLTIKSDDHKALNGWGNALAQQAKGKSGIEADELFRWVGEKYAEALKIKPDYHEAFNNWGVALADQAKRRSGPEADELFRQASEKYAQAFNIKPHHHEALLNWGVTLAQQAETKSGSDADDLFRQVHEKFAKALEIKPDAYDVLNKWGNALVHQAMNKSGPEADELFRQAGEKYAQALKIKPDYHEVFNNWGVALAEQATRTSGQEADELFALAGEKYAEAELIRPGIAAYNLACLHSTRGNFSECKRWLETSRACGNLPTKRHLETDRDLEPVRGLEWFVSFMSGI